MTTNQDNVAVSLIENGTLVYIENVRFMDGHNVGGILCFDLECLEWVTDAVEQYLTTSSISMQAFTNDRLKVKYAGSDYAPRLALYNLRSDSAAHGGPQAQSMTKAVGQSLLTQLQTVMKHQSP